MSKIGKFILPYGGSGSSPDPATYCPANGYVDETTVIPNPLLPVYGWVKILEFESNCPASATFSPTFGASSGEYSWDLGDGTIIMNDKVVSHKYIDSSTKTIRIYGRGVCTVTQATFASCYVVGTLDLRNDAFNSVTAFGANGCLGLTSVLFPPNHTAYVQTILFSACNITGNVDLSMFKRWITSTYTQVYFNTNPLLTGFTMPTKSEVVDSGQFNSFVAGDCDITGELDLSWISNCYSIGITVQVANNPNLTNVLFSSTLSNKKYAILWLDRCNLTGTLDLSAFTSCTSSSQLYVYGNPNLTDITWNASFVGVLFRFYASNTGLSVVDLTKFTSLSMGADISLTAMPNLTAINFYSATTVGQVETLSIQDCPNLAGALDLTFMKSVKTVNPQTRLTFTDLPNITNIAFNSAIAGTFVSQVTVQNVGISTLDLSKFTFNYAAGSLAIAISTCKNLSTILLQPTNITTPISSFTVTTCPLSGTLDLSKLTTFTASGSLSLQLIDISALTLSAIPITGFARILSLISNPNLSYINLSNLKTGVASLTWTFSNHPSMSPANVNQMLTEINNISAAGFTSRALNFTGTTSSPDTSSGGYNGGTATANLIAKAFAVNYPPTVSTSSVSAITKVAATCGGTPLLYGSQAITAKGCVWSINPNPTTALTTKTSNGTGATAFVSNLTGLTANTLYYIRAYVTNASGTRYGEELTFTTLL